MEKNEKRANLVFLAILVTALGVRLIGIAARPIWYDEAFSILLSEKGIPAILHGTLRSDAASSAAEEHPPAYYLILSPWLKAFGNSVESSRALSILAGLGSVYLVYRLTRGLFGEKTARLAAVFVALSPFQVHYSQEIRMYSLLTFWLLTATYAYQRGASGGARAWWIVFSVSAALAQYTHNLAVFHLVPLALWPAIRRDWKNLRAVMLAGLGALVLYGPWLIHLPSQFAKVSGAYWVERPGIESIFTLLLVYVTNLPLPDGWLFPALFLSLAVIAIALRQTFKPQNRDPGAIWLFYLSFAPPVLLFLVSQWMPVYVERALLPSGAIFCIWLAWAFFDTSLPKFIRNTSVGLLMLGTLVGLVQHATYRGFPYAPFQELDVSLRERIAPGDVILHASKATCLPMAYYDPTLPQDYIADPPGSNMDTLAASTQQVLGLVARPDIASVSRDAERIWFIVFQRHIDAHAQSGNGTHPYLSQLEQSFILQNIETWGDLRVYIFVRPPKQGNP